MLPLCSSLGLGNHFRQVPSKSLCNTMGHIKAGSSQAPFQEANISRVDFGFLRQGFLGKLQRQPMFSDQFSES